VSAPRTVDDYIAAEPESLRAMLTELRDTIRAAAPDADERLSYGMPYYQLNGRLAYFKAHAHHIGLYPCSLEEARSVGLERLVAAKATLQLPLDQPLPLAAIKRLIEQRVKSRQAGAGTSRTPKR
jgi:uncharacterized protein YdhG (YjbR/CyaY superfamily)